MPHTDAYIQRVFFKAHLYTDTVKRHAETVRRTRKRARGGAAADAAGCVAANARFDPQPLYRDHHQAPTYVAATATASKPQKLCGGHTKKFSPACKVPLYKSLWYIPDI